MSADFTDLPFVVAPLGQATSLWNTVPSGDWAKDNATGKDYAERTVLFMQTADDPAVLSLLVRSIGRTGQWTGIEAGFFNRLGEMTLSSR